MRHTHLRILATACARGFQIVRAPKRKRAKGRPGARCTRGLMCNVHQKKSAHEHTGSAETLRPSLRNGFTAYIALSLVNRSFLPPSPPRGVSLSKDLTPAFRASGPHDFAVRDSVARPRA